MQVQNYLKSGLFKKVGTQLHCYKIEIYLPKNNLYTFNFLQLVRMFLGTKIEAKMVHKPAGPN